MGRRGEKNIIYGNNIIVNTFNFIYFCFYLLNLFIYLLVLKMVFIILFYTGVGVPAAWDESGVEEVVAAAGFFFPEFIAWFINSKESL